MGDVLGVVASSLGRNGVPHGCMCRDGTGHVHHFFHPPLVQLCITNEEVTPLVRLCITSEKVMSSACWSWSMGSDSAAGVLCECVSLDETGVEHHVFQPPPFV